MIKMALNTGRCCAVPSCGKKKRSLHCLSSDANIRKEWINFILIKFQTTSVSKKKIIYVAPFPDKEESHSALQ